MRAVKLATCPATPPRSGRDYGWDCGCVTPLRSSAWAETDRPLDQAESPLGRQESARGPADPREGERIGARQPDHERERANAAVLRSRVRLFITLSPAASGKNNPAAILHRSTEKLPMEESPTSRTRHPALHYCFLAILGTFGVYVSMPIRLNPQSTIDWIDLAINIAIFIPCSLIAVVSALLALISVVSSRRVDESGRFAKFALILLRAFGLPRLSLAAFSGLTPFGVLRAMLAARNFVRPAPEVSDPRTDGHHTETL